MSSKLLLSDHDCALSVDHCSSLYSRTYVLCKIWRRRVLFPAGSDAHAQVKGQGCAYCALNGKMQVKGASFGVGLLTGLGVAIGYWRGSIQLRDGDNAAVAVEENVNTQEQLFK